MDAKQYISPSTHSNKNSEEAGRILAVDDDKTMRLVLEAQLQDLGYNVTTANNGKEALETIQQHSNKFDVIVLDREMPEMNGLDVVKLMKQDPLLKDIPVIMQTSANHPEQIKQGIDAGVYYYLTKPIDEDVMKSVLSAAVRDIRQKQVLGEELKQHKTSFNLIDSCTFHFRTLDEAESLACFIANCYSDAQRVVSGLAELLINAVEHGNLSISYDDKTNFLKESTWRQEVNRRLDLPENRNKLVEVSLRRKSDGVYVQIRDDGTGFDWAKYMQIDPARATDNHGRGIAQANAISFDKVSYNTTGNEVTAFVSTEQDLDW